MLKGQALIEWWKGASAREKNIVIAKRIFGWKRVKFESSSAVYLFQDTDGIMGRWGYTSDPVTKTIGLADFTSPDSPRRLMEEARERTISIVGKERFNLALFRVVTGHDAKEFWMSHLDHNLSAMLDADASDIGLACLLALEDQS